jgi:hypothetical protein
MGAPGSGTAYLYRCTGEFDPSGNKHDHPVYGGRDKEAMDRRIADDFAFCDCGSPIRRVYSFIAGRPMPEHFNLAAGKFVRTEAQLNEHYKRKSDELTERTGIVHDLQPVSQSDKQALNVTAEGLDATVKRREATGMQVTKQLREAAE